ncbi:hypothetical protein BPOR_0761g00040 [Botrytis porri]|uniref:Rhodopsin domain-containing protein n=1 Tax=Botrytis porri TaxID=87229 RepID=A0A4Z1KBP3_9HELO|nr:hypothetical protein BPOR_0761g00040 [Botrytis porri]
MSTTIPTPLYSGIDVDENLGSCINTVCGAMIGLSFVTLCLRFFSRWWTRVDFGKDGCFMVIIAVRILLFYNRFDTDGTNRCLRGPFQYFASSRFNRTFTVSMSGIRHSTHQGFHESALRFNNPEPPIDDSKQALSAHFVLETSGLNFLWMIIVTSIAIFSCNPIHGFWDIDIKSKCISPTNILISTEVFTIGLDLIVLVMPVYFGQSIKRFLSQRISTSSTFLIGIIVTIVSCVRLWRLIRGLALPGFDPIYMFPVDFSASDSEI